MRDELSVPPLPSVEEAIQSRDFDAVVAAGEGAVVPLLRTQRRRDRILDPWAHQALRRLGDRAETPLIRALRHTDPFVRRDAARYLAHLGSQRAVEPLVRALNDSDGILRVDAAIALGQVGETRAIEPLARALHDSSRNVVHHAGLALIAISKSHPGPIFALAEDKAQAAETRSQIFRVIANFRPNDAAAEEQRLDLLTATLRDAGEPSVIRQSAAAGLGNAMKSRVIAPLIAALTDNHSDVRASAARALGQFARYSGQQIDRRPVEPLIAMVRADDSPKARWMAILALQWFYDERALHALLSLRCMQATSLEEKRIKEAAGFVVRNMRRVARRNAAAVNAIERSDT